MKNLVKLLIKKLFKKSKSKKGKKNNKLKNYIKKIKNSVYEKDKGRVRTDKEKSLKIKKEKDTLIYLFFCLN